MTKKKKIVIGGIIAAVLLAAIIVVIIIVNHSKSQNSDGKDTVYVSAVSELTNQGGVGVLNRYSGVVEPQETVNVEKSSEKTVKDILVAEGDTVEIGTPLFTYDTDEISLKLSQAQLDLENLNNEITALNSQIATLEKERNSASADDKLDYTIQIQEAQNSLRQADYNRKAKNVEIEQLKASVNNTTVTSQLAGVVKSINKNGETDSQTGSPLPFMTITATGNFRIKGKINETNSGDLQTDMSIIIRSRTDESKTWTGTLTHIDYENPEGNQSNHYGSNQEQSNSYPFYIELDSSDGLMLGQHVYIEPDYGQSEPKEGLWLSEDFIVADGNDAYVWIKDDKDKLIKQKIETGQYDENLFSYQITSGLETTDYIAWPTDSLTEGSPCTIVSVSEMRDNAFNNMDDGNMGDIDGGNMDDGNMGEPGGDMDMGDDPNGNMDNGNIDNGNTDNGNMDGGNDVMPLDNDGASVSDGVILMESEVN